MNYLATKCELTLKYFYSQTINANFTFSKNSKPTEIHSQTNNKYQNGKTSRSQTAKT